MNRRKFLKLFGVTVASSALSATGVVPAKAHPVLDGPVTRCNPLAHFELSGVSYAVKSFNLAIENSFDYGSKQSVEVDIFDYPSSGVFNLLHACKPAPFSLYLEHEGARYCFAGDILISGVDSIEYYNPEENTTTFAGKVSNLRMEIDTLSKTR